MESAKDLCSETKTLDDLKLLHSVFKKAAAFNYSIRDMSQRHTREIFDAWRLILAAHEAVMDACNEARENFPSNDKLFTPYEAAVLYGKQLVFKEFVKDPVRDVLYQIGLDSHVKGLDALHSTRRRAKCKAWCCWFTKSAEEKPDVPEGDSEYVSFNQPNQSSMV
jgi:hypothetical protein